MLGNPLSLSLSCCYRPMASDWTARDACCVGSFGDCLGSFGDCLPPDFSHFLIVNNTSLSLSLALFFSFCPCHSGLWSMVILDTLGPRQAATTALNFYWKNDLKSYCVQSAERRKFSRSNVNKCPISWRWRRMAVVVASLSCVCRVAEGLYVFFISVRTNKRHHHLGPATRTYSLAR